MSEHDLESEKALPAGKNARGLAWQWRLPIAAAAISAGAAWLVVPILALTGSAYQARTLTSISDSSHLVTGHDRATADRLAALAPRGVFLVVDSARNRLRVFSGTELLREATCSTGTGTVLRDPRNGRSWVFDNPAGGAASSEQAPQPGLGQTRMGLHRRGFHPPTDPDDRFDDVSLGDYALYLGDGYLIHGTLFQSLLGRPATHGCIRLGDEDLEYVYSTVPVGAPVYLF